jgi:hypothetical protein
LDEQSLDDGGWQLQVEFERRDFEQLHSREGLSFYEGSEQKQPAVVGVNTV